MKERLDLEVAAVLPDIVVASTAKAMLEQAGIPVMLRSSGSLSWLVPGTPGGAGPLEVLVPRDQLPEARELLEALEAGGEKTDVGSDAAETGSGRAETGSGLAQTGGGGAD